MTVVDWFTKQTPRWGSMEMDGWEFDMPPRRRGLTGMRMTKEGTTASFYVSKDLSFRDVHTHLLEQCERFSKIEQR